MIVFNNYAMPLEHYEELISIMNPDRHTQFLIRKKKILQVAEKLLLKTTKK